MMEDNDEEGNDDNYPEFSETTDTAMEDNEEEEEGEERASDVLMRHGVDGFSPSSWEPQEEGMMSTAVNFPSVRNQGLSNSRKSQTQEGDAR
jgi:hypothetical protein